MDDFDVVIDDFHSKTEQGDFSGEFLVPDVDIVHIEVDDVDVDVDDVDVQVETDTIARPDEHDRFLPDGAARGAAGRRRRASARRMSCLLRGVFALVLLMLLLGADGCAGGRPFLAGENAADGAADRCAFRLAVMLGVGILLVCHVQFLSAALMPRELIAQMAGHCGSTGCVPGSREALTTFRPVSSRGW